jgi:hypothetical protein
VTPERARARWMRILGSRPSAFGPPPSALGPRREVCCRGLTAEG